MNTKHTPAPWLVGYFFDANGYITCNPAEWDNGKYIGKIMPSIEQGNMANAKAQAVELDRLRAINAELLAALQTVVSNANGKRETGYSNVPWATIDNASAAIEKATK